MLRLRHMKAFEGNEYEDSIGSIDPTSSLLHQAQKVWRGVRHCFCSRKVHELKALCLELLTYDLEAHDAVLS